MIIHNVRVGLATNSSSTHSIILMDQNTYKTTETDEYHDFGWQFFTAANQTSKENYLAYILRASLVHKLGESNTNVIIDGLFPNRCENIVDGSYSEVLEKEGYGVDHQSVFSLPVNWDGKGVDLDFFKALRDYFLDNPIAILGGNDNTEEEHPLRGDGRTLDLGLPEDYSDMGAMVARYDSPHWVVFNRGTGAKVRLTFTTCPPGPYQDNPVTEDTLKARKFLKGPQVEVTKAAAPELVDIKITDYCPFGCKYCYQGSTAKGTHAKTDTINTLSYALGRMHVFEVALGGGEPTMHPDFLKILHGFRHNGIVPNFTTRSLEWLKGKHAKEILDTCGAFAYSVNTAADVRRFAAVAKKFEDKPHSRDDKFSVQYVLGTGGNLYELLEEARKNHLRVTLLGFKRVGFGKDFKEKSEDWIATVKKIRKEESFVRIGVDTAIIQGDGQRIMSELNVSPLLMTTEEGKFSMYIDAVAETMGPSSYCDKSLMVPLRRPKFGIFEEDILKDFRQW